jgi:hypothetical protein
MKKFQDHPDISRTLCNGYEFDEDDFDQDAYDAYCDMIYEQRREAEIFGEE